MKNKSLKINMILNVLKTFMSIIFPLITYPYATRVLGVENFGKINYSNSVITYVALIASLGIASYAIREGGFYRYNQTILYKYRYIEKTTISYGCISLYFFINFDSIKKSSFLLIMNRGC